MHNLGNKKALQRILGGIKELWIANTRSINTEQYRGEFKHEVRQFEKSYDNQQAEQISLMV
ncbi:hypothetical protein [Acinetobacter baumannii]|uniref:hypothetical protein n=1 Tax=Acinetobacter baumannii TaxID=470 RepID=UPI0009A4205B